MTLVRKILGLGIGFAIAGHLVKMNTGASTSLSGVYRTRGCDVWGCGNFGASRTHGSHNGVDIILKPGESFKSPVSGQAFRVAKPYADHPEYSGLALQDNDGNIWKFFYINPIPTPSWVSKGQSLGTGQDLGKLYPGITPHVHVEVKNVQGNYINPLELM